MSFDPAIAVKRDPDKAAGPKPVSALAKTLVFEASGALSHDGAAALAEAIYEAVSPEFRNYIVRFQSTTDVDNGRPSTEGPDSSGALSTKVLTSYG